MSQFPFFNKDELNEQGFNPGDPFKICQFGRQDFAYNLIDEIDINRNKGFVIGVEAHWGHGKSTFMDMLGAKLEDSGHIVIPFNAWSTDFANDPLLAFMATFAEGIGENNKFEKIKKYISVIMGESIDASDELLKILDGASGGLKTIVGTADVAHGGLLTAAVQSLRAGKKVLNIHEKAKNKANKTPYDTYLKQRKLYQDFKEKLTKFSKEVYKQNNKPIVILVDELDRCRPSYAIELLENIKHFFDVPHIVFVLSVNHTQLENAFEHVYGLNSSRLKFEGKGKLDLRNIQDKEKPLNFRLNKINTAYEDYFIKLVPRFYTIPKPNYWRQSRSFFEDNLERKISECKINILPHYSSLNPLRPIVIEALELFPKWVVHLLNFLNSKYGIVVSPRELTLIMEHVDTLFSGELKKILFSKDNELYTCWHLYITFFLCLFYHKKKDLHILGIKTDTEGNFTSLFGVDVTYDYLGDKPEDIMSAISNENIYNVFGEGSIAREIFCMHGQDVDSNDSYILYAAILGFFEYFNPYSADALTTGLSHPEALTFLQEKLKLFSYEREEKDGQCSENEEVKYILSQSENYFPPKEKFLGESGSSGFATHIMQYINGHKLNVRG